MFMLKFKDVRFRANAEYDPKAFRADKNGYRRFWIAEIPINGEYEFVCYAYKKADCEQEARRLVKDERELLRQRIVWYDTEKEKAAISVKQCKRENDIIAMQYWENEVKRIQNKIDMFNKMLLNI